MTRLLRWLTRLYRRAEPIDLDPLPWWYCPYCGDIFNHGPPGDDRCPTFVALSAHDGIARSVTPHTGNPAE